MALVESIDIDLGTLLPPFSLQDPHGQEYFSERLVGSKGLLVVFTCNHCPYALAIWSRLIRLAHWAIPQRIQTVAINPNIHPNYPEDSSDQMLQKIEEWQIPFPYLIDATQEVARAFKAQCTPDLYLFDADKKLVFHGRMDDNWKDESHVTQEELKDAIKQLLQGEVITVKPFPSMGCSIKWKES